MSGDNLKVVVHFDSFDADKLGEDGWECRLRASHSIRYRPQADGTFIWANDGSNGWSDTVCPVNLESEEACVYDACVRFEIHEVKHFLRYDDAEGKNLVEPHPPE
jgi:hypothetical protein